MTLAQKSKASVNKYEQRKEYVIQAITVQFVVRWRGGMRKSTNQITEPFTTELENGTQHQQKTQTRIIDQRVD